METKDEKVRKIVSRCLFSEAEVPNNIPPAGAIIVDGIVNKFVFHVGRIEESKEEIRWLLNEMPESFHAQSGGGMSFLNLCLDKHGEHWAEHSTMCDLICLGIAAKMASYCLPRDKWHIFPGGMPYVTIDTIDTPGGFVKEILARGVSNGKG